MEGKVYFVGAGPGSPDLLTLRAVRILGRADVVIWADSLISPEVTSFCRPDAQIRGSSSLTLPEIVDLMREGACEGKVVARLHSGDPSLYGALLEEMRALEMEGIPYEIVPGVSSLFAAAASLKVELTVPGICQTVIVTRAPGRTPVPEEESLRSLAQHRATMALFLSAARLWEAVEALIEGGYNPETPAALVHRASWPDEVILWGTLGQIPALAKEAGISRQAIVLVGRALDPSLKGPKGPSSRLYDPTFSHMFRKAKER